jgi:hypothetical protein
MATPIIPGQGNPRRSFEEIARNEQRKSDMLEAIDQNLSSEPFDRDAYTEWLRNRCKERKNAIAAERRKVIRGILIGATLLLVLIVGGKIINDAGGINNLINGITESRFSDETSMNPNYSSDTVSKSQTENAQIKEESGISKIWNDFLDEILEPRFSDGTPMNPNDKEDSYSEGGDGIAR